MVQHFTNREPEQFAETSKWQDLMDNIVRETWYSLDTDLARDEWPIRLVINVTYSQDNEFLRVNKIPKSDGTVTCI